MEWQFVAEREGRIIYESEDSMPDPFWDLHQMTKETGDGARVSNTVQRSLAYGELKVSCSVSVSCPQTAAHIAYAGYLTFATAVQFVNNGFGALVPDAPRLEVPQWISKT